MSEVRAITESAQRGFSLLLHLSAVFLHFFFHLHSHGVQFNNRVTNPVLLRHRGSRGRQEAKARAPGGSKNYTNVEVNGV